MVRLEATLPVTSYIPNSISIPIWFDWKGLIKFIQIIVGIFQFLYGSIGSYETDIKSIWRSISIPIWFDWKKQPY